jgi:hypothetical protein
MATAAETLVILDELDTLEFEGTPILLCLSDVQLAHFAILIGGGANKADITKAVAKVKGMQDLSTTQNLNDLFASTVSTIMTFTAIRLTNKKGLPHA